MRIDDGAPRTATHRTVRDGAPSWDTATEIGVDGPLPSGIRLRRSTVLAAVVAVIAVRLGSAPLGDNSLFTHIATGRRLVRGDIGSLFGGWPDPYSRVSAGEPWVVQSWLASVLLGTADAVAGGVGVRLLFGAVMAALVLAVWRLGRPGGVTVQVGTTVLALTIGATAWLQRPLLFGLLALAVLWLVAEERRDARWAAPVMALWVNVHGSFPLGLVLLAARAAGRRLDGEDLAHDRRLLGWAALGTVVGGVANPVGPALLLFPLRLLSRNEVLQYVVEWRSPNFADGWTRLFLVLVIAAIVGLVRRPSWASALPTIVAVVAALLATRNIAVATVVLVPAVARGLAGVGEIDGDAAATGAWRAVPAVMVVALAAVVVGVGRTDDYALETYPVPAVEWLESRSLLDGSVDVVHQDWVGNYLTLTQPGFPVHIDDRFELHPPSFVTSYRTLVVGGPEWRESVGDSPVVLWQRGTPLEAIMREAADWRVAWEDDDWFVACRRDVAACG